MYEHLCSTSYHTSSNAFDLLPQCKLSAKLEAGGWKSVRNCYLFTLKQCVVLKRKNILDEVTKSVLRVDSTTPIIKALASLKR